MACRLLKAHAPTANIPVVALSQARREDVERGTRAGCDAFVCKPCIAEELLACVKALLSDRARLPQGTLA